MFKKFSSVFFVLLLAFCLFACSSKDEIDYSKLKVEKPNQDLLTADYELDFEVMHNSVIDYITNESMPFFFVKNNEFEISGSNEEKVINVNCKCIDGTTYNDLELFLSMVLNGIGINAAEQDFRFKVPTESADGYYTDFGSVFDYYDVKLFSDTDDGTVLINLLVKAGYQIPIDPRYIMG